ncbi:MAG TPA: DUF4365 and DUF1817 domain-containing protein [Candidatus Paceibacterota bacterium]|nr:DUF4365 and DUF1817 domain-containing protein [Candidatus Paceibacterota bacterium]
MNYKRMFFPKRTLSQKSGEIGINLVSKIVTDSGMIFRKIPQEYDYGLDAHIDFVNEKGFVTGGSVGVQIKHGSSYFEQETSDGYWYSGSIAHLNYFLNQNIPIFIFLVHPNLQDIFWAEFDPNHIHKSGENWKILVQKSNILETSFFNRISTLCVADDFSSSMQDHLAYKEAISKVTATQGNFIHVGIRRQSIESCNTSGIVSYFEGLKSSKKIIKESQGKVSFFVKGYDDDPRELYEIPEVVAYFKKIEPEVKYWFYFLNTDPISSSLQTFMFILCSPIEKKIIDDESFTISFDLDIQKKFFKRNFLWLNEITNFLGISSKENEIISENILKYYQNICVS